MSFMDDDKFDRHFDRLDRGIENMAARPGKTFLKFGLVALVLNLVFWLVIIAAIVVGIMLVL